MILTTLNTIGELLCLGDFLGAADLLGDEWPGPGVYPDRDGHDDISYARLLMSCAVLTINLGSIRLLNVQDVALDMLTESARLFGTSSEALTPRLWQGVAYFWRGEYHEAKALAQTILDEKAGGLEVEVGALLTQAIAEMGLGRGNESLATLDRVIPLLPGVSPMVQGKYYLNRGIAFRNLERQAEALIAYNKAGQLFEEVKSFRYEGAVVNNLAGIYTDQGRFIKAHVAADRAVSLFRKIRDKAHEAKAWDQIAKIYIKEKRFSLAVKPAQNAVALLADSDHEGWLAEALTTQGIALFRAGAQEGVAALNRAAKISERLGIPAEATYNGLWDAIKQSKEVVTALRPMEEMVIERALDRHKGKVTKAARDLGITHQALEKKIKAFPALQEKRSIPRKRYKTVLARK